MWIFSPVSRSGHLAMSPAAHIPGRLELCVDGDAAIDRDAGLLGECDLGHTPMPMTTKSAASRSPPRSET
jgi:hypothetical protein